MVRAPPWPPSNLSGGAPLPSLLVRAFACLLVDPSLRGLIDHASAGAADQLGFLIAWARRIDSSWTMTRVPFGIDRDRLIGGIDLEKTLRLRLRVLMPGLLRPGGQTMLLAHHLDHFDPWLLGILKHYLENEGQGAILVGTAPADASLAGIADAVAFRIREPEAEDAEARFRRLAASLETARNVTALHRELDLLKETVLAARKRVRSVRIPDAALKELVSTSAEFRVEGGRATLFAVRAARAHAALAMRPAVAREDLEFAVSAVLRHRFPAGMEPERDLGRRDADSEGEPTKERVRALGEEPNLERARAPAEHGGSAIRESSSPGAKASGSFGEAIFGISPIGTLPDLSLLVRGRRRGGRHGRRTHQSSLLRGHHLRSQRGFPPGARLALAATLRRAALRCLGKVQDPGTRLRLDAADLCFRELRERCGALLLVAVDASGSMARNRMREAKGLVLGFLERAYIERDRVALVAFRGKEALLALPPTGAIERARLKLEVLPTGGGTPLAAAIVMVSGLARRERRRRPNAPVIAIFLSDGGANVPLGASLVSGGRNAILRELSELAARYRALAMPTLVVDTAPSWSGETQAARVADLLGARCVALPW